ncbi:site-specific integrase [Mesorhizobium sp. M0048]|uniref:tyrosine-type recombinase/integrase n=1 Tax=Mesorhizobium sp. M0048 TaxID=2956860 RepID=UPI00333BDC1B
MSIRKRTWTTKKGTSEAYLVDYTDQTGHRQVRQFTRRKDAVAFRDQTGVEVRNNSHVPLSADITVEKAGEYWLKRARDDLETKTADQYEQHLRLHIVPFIGKEKISCIGIPEVRKFMDKLKEAGRSGAMVKSVRTSLSGIISEAQERGHSVRNAVREMSQRRKGKEARHAARRKAKLKIGVDIPSPAEVQSILVELSKPNAAYRELIITAIFTGMRASELRGLRWTDVDLKHKKIHVTQRADANNEIGRPKSEAGERTIPMFDYVANTLTHWKTRCPKGELGLVFPTQNGTVQRHENIVRRGLCAPQIAAGLTKQKVLRTKGRKPVLDKDGKQQFITVAKYEGLHALRHFFASWSINSKSRDGRGMNPKEVQDVLGHSTLALTMDTYGHLFPATDDAAAMAAAEAALLGPLSATKVQQIS